MKSESFNLYKNQELLTVLILATIISFSWLGLVTLFDVDEAVFAQATKEMLESGDFITPHYNDNVRYDKPILIYWLMALSFKIFGINEVGARFVSALAGVILSIGMYFFIKEFIKENKSFSSIAFYSVSSFILSFYFFVYTHAAVTDMLLSLFISFSLFSFYRWYVYRNERYIYLFMIFCALGFLTKGLIAIVLPGFIVVLFLFIKKEIKSVLIFFNLKFLFVFCIIGLPWYIIQYIINGNEFIEQFFFKHHFKRYTDVISSHSGPIYYYIICLLIGTFPWIFYNLSNFKYLFNEIKRKESLILFSIIWFLSFFIFFSLSTTKLPNYILPGIIPFFILTGISIKNNEFNSSFNNYIIIIFGILNLIILFFIMEKYSYLLHYAIIFILFQLFLFMIYFFYKKQIIYIYSVIILNTIFLPYLFMPIASKHLQRTLYNYSLYIKELTYPDEKILMYKVNKPSVLFYSDRKVIHISKRDMIRDVYDILPRYAISESRSKDIELLISLGYKIINDDRKFVLYEKDY